MVSGLRRSVPRFIRKSYALKFAIVLLILGVSVGAIGIIGTAQVQDGVQSNVYENHETLALQQSDSIGEFHSENLRTVESLAQNSGLDRDDQEAATEYVETEISNRGGGGIGEVHLHFLDTESGDVIASSMVDSDTELEGEWVDNLGEEERPYVTNTYRSGGYDGSTPRVAYVASAGVGDLPEGTALVYTVPLSEYTVSSTDGTRMMVVDGNGMVAIDERNRAILEEYDETGDPLTDAEDLDSNDGAGMEGGPASGVLTTDDQFDQQTYVVGYSPVPGTDWVALVHTPTDQAYGFVEDVRQFGILATIGAVLLIGAVGAVIGWNTSRSIDRLTTKAERMEDGDLNVDLDSPRIDSIGRLYDGFDNMRVSLKEQITEAHEAREEAEQARAETERINEHLEQKADEYSDVMQTAAAGDLTARMDTDTDNEAMKEIAEEFNQMLDELERTTASVKAFATEVATASEQVTASSEEVRSASEQVTESIQEISDGADRQNDSLQAVNGEMDELSTTTEEIAASSNEVADIAERTARAGKRGREAAQEAIEGMNEIETESDAAVDEIEQLQAEVEQIDELLEFITEIAEQTNMLALNANIEASRSNSGNNDEGFSVVAKEVKSLAEETKDAATDIENRLDRIKEQTDRTADEVQRTSDRVSEHAEAVDHAVEALDEIAEYAEETNVGVQEISAATEEQAASTQEVVAMVDDASTIAEETSAESETVAAAAEEQTTALTEVSRSAGQLADQAAQLSETLDYFETESDPEMDIASDDTTLEFDTDDETATVFDESEQTATTATDSDGVIGSVDSADSADVEPGESTDPVSGAESVTDSESTGFTESAADDEDDEEETDAAADVFEFDEPTDES